MRAAIPGKPIDRIVRLLGDARIERRCAAAMVLGELGDRKAVPALCQALGEDNALVQRYVLEALAALGAKAEAAPHLAPLLQSADPEVRARASTLLAERGSGPAAAAALRRELAPEVPIARRRAVLHVLAQQRSAPALDALLGAFADEALADHALAALRAEIDGLDARGKKLVADRAEALLGREKKDPAAAAHALRLLGHLGDPGTLRSILAHAGPRHPPAVRAAALAALRRPLAHANGRKDEIALKVLGYADDEDADVAREALGTLQSLPLPEGATPTLLKLASASRHADTRRFAVERVGQADVGAREAAALLGKLEAPDAAVREAAARALARLPAAAVPLVKALVGADSPDRVRRLVGILRGGKVVVTAPLREALAQRALELLDHGAPGDTLAEELLEALRHLDPALYAERLCARAERLRRAHHPAEAWATFRRLLRAGVPLPDEARYAAAVLGIKASGKELLRAARSVDPALGQLVALLRAGFPVAQKLRKEKELEPDELFYVGFNFVESHDETEKELGAEILEHLQERAPRSKLGKSARNKLHLVGWSA